MDVHGTNGRVIRLPAMGNWKRCNGPGRIHVHGMQPHALLRPNMVIWKPCNGPVPTDARGTNGRAKRRQNRGIMQCWIGHGRMGVPSDSSCMAAFGKQNAFNSYLWKGIDLSLSLSLSHAERDTTKIEEYGLAKWAENVLNLNTGLNQLVPLNKFSRLDVSFCWPRLGTRIGRDEKRHRRRNNPLSAFA